MRRRRRRRKENNRNVVVVVVVVLGEENNRILWHFKTISMRIMLSFLINDFLQTEQNQLMSAPQEQNVDWENASIMRIDIVLKAIKFNSFPPPPPPPPPHFYCFPSTTTTTTFLLFSFFLLLLLLLLISIVFPPPPPPLHFYYFSSSSSSMTSLINPSNWIYLMRFHRKLMRYHSILFMRSRQ